MAKSPNVIVVVTDDQGYGDLSCYGNPVLQTPHLDALFAESVRLADYHVDPMCAPTRAALMTGRYAARTGVWSTLRGRFIMRRDEVTMGDVFKASGYRTGLFGKWHLGDNYPYRPQDRGFEDVLSFGGGVVGEIPDYWDNDNFTATYMRNGKPEQLTKYCTDLWFDEAIRFIEAHREEPFFCYLPTNAPHGPFDVHEKYSQPYLERGVEDQRTKFYGMIANIDENMGRLRQRLRGLDLEENTFLIFMGDNGTSAGCGLDRQGFLTNGFNGGMWGKKAWVYEGGHRNACFLFWPEGGIDGVGDIGSVTTHMDLLPTLIELCDLEAPAVHFDGDSLAPALTDPSFFWPDRTLFVQQQQVDQSVK